MDNEIKRKTSFFRKWKEIGTRWSTNHHFAWKLIKRIRILYLGVRRPSKISQFFLCNFHQLANQVHPSFFGIYLSISTWTVLLFFYQIHLFRMLSIRNISIYLGALTWAVLNEWIRYTTHTNTQKRPEEIQMAKWNKIKNRRDWNKRANWFNILKKQIYGCW